MTPKRDYTYKIQKKFTEGVLCIAVNEKAVFNVSRIPKSLQNFSGNLTFINYLRDFSLQGKPFVNRREDFKEGFDMKDNFIRVRLSRRIFVRLRNFRKGLRLNELPESEPKRVSKMLLKNFQKNF